MFAVNLDAAEIFLYDDIGPAYYGMIDAGSVIAALGQMTGRLVKLRLNSAGGSVDDAVAIYNAAKRHPGGVNTYVDSLAASAASHIAQAGQRRFIAANGRLMLHNPWTFAIGNAAGLRKTADVLDVYSASMVGDYVSRSGRTEEDIKAILAEETWYAAADAIANGFADEIDAEGHDIPAPVVPEGRFAKTPSDITGKAVAGSRNARRVVDARIGLTRVRI